MKKQRTWLQQETCGGLLQLNQDKNTGNDGRQYTVKHRFRVILITRNRQSALDTYNKYLKSPRLLQEYLDSANKMVFDG